jgi:hypothetical protein
LEAPLVILLFLQAVIALIGKDTGCHENTSSLYLRTIHYGHLRNYPRHIRIPHS